MEQLRNDMAIFCVMTCMKMQDLQDYWNLLVDQND